MKRSESKVTCKGPHNTIFMIVEGPAFCFYEILKIDRDNFVKFETFQPSHKFITRKRNVSNTQIVINGKQPSLCWSKDL